MKDTLKARTIDYLRRRGGWVSNGELQRIVATKTKYTPQNLGRRLREAVNDGDLDVEYRTENGVQHAWYKARTSAPEPKRPAVPTFIMRDGVPVAVFAA